MALYPCLKTPLSGVLNLLFRLLVERSVIDLADGNFAALPDDLGADLSFAGTTAAATDGQCPLF